MKRARGDEQDVIGPNHPVLRIHRRAFDDRENVALHALAADVGPVRALASRDLVDFVDEDDAGLLDPLDRGARNAVHVDQLLLFFLREIFERFRHLHLAPLGLALKEAGQHVLEVDVDFLDLRTGDDFERRKRFLAHVDLDRARIEAAGAQLFAEPLTRLVLLLARRDRILIGRGRPRRRQEDVEQAVFGGLCGLRPHLFEAFLADHVDAKLHEVAHHRLDVASVNFEASTLTNGDCARRARRRAISVLPTPVGPIIRMFFGAISSASSGASF